MLYRKIRKKIIRIEEKISKHMWRFRLEMLQVQSGQKNLLWVENFKIFVYMCLCVQVYLEHLHI